MAGTDTSLLFFLIFTPLPEYFGVPEMRSRYSSILRGMGSGSMSGRSSVGFLSSPQSQINTSRNVLTDRQQLFYQKSNQVHKSGNITLTNDSVEPEGLGCTAVLCSDLGSKTE